MNHRTRQSRHTTKRHQPFKVGHVREPTLIVHPRKDDRASLHNLDYLQTNLGGLSFSVILNDSYHLVTIDRQRQIA
jgi:esterase/lipase